MRWKTIAIFGPLIPFCAFVVSVTVAHESPVFLIGRDKVDGAKLALKRLYGPGYRVDEEVEIIQENLRERKKNLGGSSTWNYFAHLRSNPGVNKPFLIVLFLIILQQFSGMSVLRAYVVKIFDEVFSNPQNATLYRADNKPDCGHKTGLISSEAYLSAIVIGIVRLVASLLLSKLLRIYRRRSMYFISAFCSVVALLGFATCNLVIDHGNTTNSVALETTIKWAALITACFLVFSVQLGIQTLPFLLSGELFPSDIRAFCKGLTRSLACLFLVANLKLYPFLESQIGISGSFYLFGATLAMLGPVVYFILPETKDLGLEVIQEYFTPRRTVFYVDQTPPCTLEGCNECIPEINYLQQFVIRVLHPNILLLLLSRILKVLSCSLFLFSMSLRNRVRMPISQQIPRI